MANISVRFEITDNTQIMAFIASQKLAEQPLEYSDQTEAFASPLAEKIFGFPWADRVLINNETVYVTKQDWVDWDVLAEPLCNLIQRHLNSPNGLQLEKKLTSSKSAQVGQLIIQAQETPNPEARMFQVSQTIANQTVEFQKDSDTTTSPLAKQILNFPWATSVTIGSQFVTVTKNSMATWDLLTSPLQKLIEEYFAQGQPAVLESANNQIDENDSEIVKQIKSVLNQEIRPAVAQDGGDIVFQRYENDVLFVHMKGACNGCPSSTATLKQGIERRLKQSIPSLMGVVAVS